LNVYKGTLKKLVTNYVIGSVLGVVGVGSTLVTLVLHIRQSDVLLLLLIQFFSFCMMLFVEYKAFQKDIAPIRDVFVNDQVTEQQFYLALVQAKRFPLLTARRIIVPHFLGLSIPAVVMTTSLIALGVLHIPFIDVVYAICGAVLIMLLHAIIEFF